MKNNQNQSKLLKLNGDPTRDIKALIHFSEQDQIDMDSNFTFFLKRAIEGSDIKNLQAMKENKDLNKVFKDIYPEINRTYNKKKEEVMPTLTRDVENVRSMQDVKNAYAALDFSTITKDQSPDSKELMADLALRSINIIARSTNQSIKKMLKDEDMMSVLEELQKSNPLQKSIFSLHDELNNYYNQRKKETMFNLTHYVENVRSMQDVKNTYNELYYSNITEDKSPESKKLMADLAVNSINIIARSTDQERQNISQDEDMMFILEKLQKSNPLQKSIFSSLNSASLSHNTPVSFSNKNNILARQNTNNSLGKGNIFPHQIQSANIPEEAKPAKVRFIPVKKHRGWSR